MRKTQRKIAKKTDGEKSLLSKAEACARLLALLLSAALFILCMPASITAQRDASPRAVVVVVVVVADERLAVLRQMPAFDAPLLRRLSRGRRVVILGTRRSREGVEFCRVAITRRTRGWLQCASLLFPARAGEDARLLRLIESAEGFERIARSQVFLKYLWRSSLQPVVLAAAAEAADRVAIELTRDARSKLSESRLAGSSAPAFTYYLNYSGLDRYNRQGVIFIYDQRANCFYYNGAHWRKILRRYPLSPEAQKAHASLAKAAG